MGYKSIYKRLALYYCIIALSFEVKVISYIGILQSLP